MGVWWRYKLLFGGMKIFDTMHMKYHTEDFLLCNYFQKKTFDYKIINNKQETSVKSAKLNPVSKMLSLSVLKSVTPLKSV